MRSAVACGLAAQRESGARSRAERRVGVLPTICDRNTVRPNVPRAVMLER